MTWAADRTEPNMFGPRLPADRTESTVNTSARLTEPNRTCSVHGWNDRFGPADRTESTVNTSARF
jgi:hypothetical protein